ncbi:MAG: lipid-A-disaccharide synthase [Syntrophales bacterium]
MHPEINTRKIMIVAGEASGDLHGADLVKAMHGIDPALRFYGIGGKRLREAGIKLTADSADMAVVGLTEVIFKLRFILKVLGQLKASLKKTRPELVILIDYPDFNLSLAKAAKKCGLRVFYYISPQVWAWRKGRIGKIRKVVDKMAVIFPFEARLYEEADVDVTFVGHPLLDVVSTKYSREEARRRFGLQEGTTTVGIIPGSRPSEVVKLLPEMLKAAEILVEKLAAVQFILPVADTLEMDFISHIVRQYPVEVRLIPHDTYEAIGCTDIVMAASGTVTLETALLGIPMVIVYKVSALTYYIGKIFVKVDNFGIVNIIAGKTIVPELIQKEANHKRIAAEIIDILGNRGQMDNIKKELSKIRAKLGSPGAAERTARLAYGMIEGK